MQPTINFRKICSGSTVYVFGLTWSHVIASYCVSPMYSMQTGVFYFGRASGAPEIKTPQKWSTRLRRALCNGLK